VGKRGLTIVVSPSLHVKVEKSRKVEKVDLAPAHVKRGEGGSRKKILTMLNESDWGAVIVDVERRKAIVTCIVEHVDEDRD